MPHLLSVNVGLPREVSWQGKSVRTGVWKSPVEGARMVRRLNIDGDGQGDLHGHGGEHRAVLVYQIEAYHYWETYLGQSAFGYGQFGENFTVDGLPDTEVCIGDRYRIGRAVFEVSQPRVTCYRLGIRMNRPDMAALLVAHRRPGFYFRVIEEGDVKAGDEITQLASGPERMSVSDIDALLYLPGHPRDQLERALRIPVLPAGWRRSFEALLTQDSISGSAGNAGLTGAASPAPAWPGFRAFRVARKVRESASVTSLLLEPTDGQPLASPLPGQFIVLRPQGASAPGLMRSYSLSGAQGGSSWRISIKREPKGAASGYIDDRLQAGDIVDASAARGTFTLRPGNTPVVLISAGIGVTPVLAMLHAMARDASTREVWWLHGARNGREHPFAAEARALLGQLVHAHTHISYSAPDATDRPNADFDTQGRLDSRLLEALRLPRNGDYYICGPSIFMSNVTSALHALGISPGQIHTEIFGTGPSMAPGVVASVRPPPHLPEGEAAEGPSVSFARSGLNVRWSAAYDSLLELAEACDVPVRWSCRTGVCHTCEVGLVAGRVAYGPEPITPPAVGNLLICCSRPDGDVVIDL